MSALPAPSPLSYAFRYLSAEKADLYRSVMAAFVEARERYQLHLRPEDVVEAGGLNGAAAEVETALAQLCEWGNLDKHPDTADVQTVEQFKRPRYLYSLTPAGAAAEKAVGYFHKLLGQQGKLDTLALRDVQDYLRELEQVLGEPEPDAAKARRTLTDLIDCFDRLTDEAQVFLQTLLRSIELQTMELQAFLAYKQKLIDYLEHFIHELVLATVQISQTLGRISDGRVRGHLEEIAREEFGSLFNPDPAELEGLRRRWVGRWDGLKSWFLAGPEGACEAAQLRGRARAAIPAFLEAVSGINERRVRRSDRTADFRTLARWFLMADSDEQAHRLWRAAFGLASSRHLRVDPTTLEARAEEPVPPVVSWLDAPPLRLSPRLRKTGRHTRRGPASRVVDRAEEQARLRRLAERQAEQIEAARTRLITPGRIRLSDFSQLEPAAFQLLLDLLGHALSRKRREEDAVEASSTDGSLTIHMQPTGEARTATIRTSWGDLTGADHFVTIRETLPVAYAEAEGG